MDLTHKTEITIERRGISMPQIRTLKKALRIMLKTVLTTVYLLFLAAVVFSMLLTYTMLGVNNNLTEFDRYMRYNSDAPLACSIIWFIIAVVNFSAMLICSKTKNGKIPMIIHAVLGIICIVALLTIIITANFVYKTKL